MSTAVMATSAANATAAPHAEAARGEHEEPEARRLDRVLGPVRAHLLPGLLQQLGDEARPSRLVTGTNAGAVVAVEVLVEEDEVAPVRIGGEALHAAVDRAPPIRVAQEDPRESPGELRGDLPQGHHLPRPRRELDLQLAAIEVVEALERLDD